MQLDDMETPVITELSIYSCRYTAVCIGDQLLDFSVPGSPSELRRFHFGRNPAVQQVWNSVLCILDYYL